MQQIEVASELLAQLDAIRRRGERIGFVPTMGALHEGHLSLCRASTKANSITVVSIFVNPLQFGPGEDFNRYPRNLQTDQDLLSSVGVHFVFTPDPVAFYPPGFSTYVEVEGLSRPLEGESRPGHFRGVATVVLKLLNCVGPCTAYLGHKDFQQLQVVKRMVQDLSVAAEIEIVPTVRETDGLAMSSRNQYLNFGERRAAPFIYQALQIARAEAQKGVTQSETLVGVVQDKLAGEPLLQPEYVALVDPETMQPLAALDRTAIMLTAVRVGSTRLIDNIVLAPAQEGPRL